MSCFYGKARKRVAYHRSLFCAPNICSVPEKGVSGTEYHSCTRKACFFTPSDPENASRTVGGCFAHRAHIPYHRRPSPVPNVPNATNARDKRPLPHTAPSANPHECQRKETSSHIALPANPHKYQKKKPFPRRHHRQMPIGKSLAAALLWQKGIVYSGGGARAHGFNYFLTLFL